MQLTAEGHFLEGFLKSWGMILASEIGDKTFFIAAIMAMKHPRLTVYTGAIAALSAMTVLSAVMGWAAPNLISKKYTHWAAVALFFFFGARSLYDAITGEEGESELEEVEREIQAKEADFPTSNQPDNGDGKAKPRKGEGMASRLVKGLFSPVLIEAFVLTFLAEWGDRSQIATIGLAASIDMVGVTLGGILGHSICTGVAVLGGRQMAAHIREKTVAIIGGLLFIAFGIHACFDSV